MDESRVRTDGHARPGDARLAEFVERARGEARSVQPPDAQRTVAAMMAAAATGPTPAQPAGDGIRRRWKAVIAAAAVGVATLAGGTGLAAADALPGPLQGVMHDWWGHLDLAPQPRTTARPPIPLPQRRRSPSRMRSLQKSRTRWECPGLLVLARPD